MQSDNNQSLVLDSQNKYIKLIVMIGWRHGRSQGYRITVSHHR